MLNAYRIIRLQPTKVSHVYRPLEGLKNCNYFLFKAKASVKVVKDKISRYPDEGFYQGNSIETNSWTVINHELLVDREYIAIRFYYDIIVRNKTFWNWHKTYKNMTPANKSILCI
jgi:hypothetical protein